MEFQAYSAGEDVRRIDWRTSARRGRPFLRRYHDELSSDWLLCLDRSASMGRPDERKWQMAVQLTAAFAFLLLHAGHRVGMLQFSSRIDRLCPLGRGRMQYMRIAGQLQSSEVRPAAGDSRLAAAIPVMRPGVHVAVLSDFLRPDAMRPDLEGMRGPGRRIHAIQILSPRETRRPDPAVRAVRDVESGRAVAVDADSADAAASALENLREGLSAFSREAGIKLSNCSAEERWQEVMLRHLANGHA